MATFSRPDVFVEEREQLEGPIQPSETGFGALQGVTEKGPVGVPVRTRSFPDWKRVFGQRELASRSDMAYEAKMFFDEGGVELITSRSAHYSDIDDPDSVVGGVAEAASQTQGVVATSATKEPVAAGPFNFEDGDTVALDVDNVGPVAPSFDGTAATAAGAGLSITDLTGLTALIEMNNDGEDQVITFNGAESTPELVAQTINAQLTGGSAQVNAGQVDIVSDIEGTDSEVDITGGTALGEIGHSIGVDNGSGNVGNIDAVLSSEVKTIVEAATVGLTLTVNPDQTIAWASDSDGGGSELDFQASAGLAVLGLVIEVIVGLAGGGTQLTLTLKSGYHGTLSPGVRGNELKKVVTRNPLHPSAGAGSDLAADAGAAAASIQVVSLNGLSQGSVVELDDGSGGVEYHEVSKTRVVVSAGVATFFIDLVVPTTLPFTAAASTMSSREFDLELFDGDDSKEFHENLSMLDTADNYVETILNDENVGSEYVVAVDEDAAAGLGADLPATDSAKVAFTGGSDETIGLVDADIIGSPTGGTGFYAFDNVREFMPWATPGQNSTAVVHAAGQYSNNRLYLFYVAFVSQGLSGEAAKSYRENTLGVDNDKIGLYAGGAKLFDPAGSGSSPRRLIAAVGGIMGVMARVDSLPEPLGGPWNAPAGEGQFGVFRSALDVATVYGDSDAEICNPVGVNLIRKFGRTDPVTIFGARTLDASTAGKFKYINVRRFFQFAEKSIADSTRWAVFRNNDFRLWGRLADRVDDFLLSLLARRAFPTADKALAYFINVGVPQGTMTQADIDNGRVIGEIGLAAQKPGEFIIWRFTQFDQGTTVDEQ